MNISKLDVDVLRFVASACEDDNIALYNEPSNPFDYQDDRHGTKVIAHLRDLANRLEKEIPCGT